MSDQGARRVSMLNESTEKDALLTESAPQEFRIDEYAGATESLDIEKAFLSVVVEKIKSPSALNITNSHEEFDWLGDDADLLELQKGMYTGPPVGLNSKTSLYDNAQPSEIRLSREEAEEGESEDEEALERRIIPRKIFHIGFLSLQLGLIVLASLGFAGYDLGHFAGVAVHYWSLLVSMIIFVPLLLAWAIQITLKKLRHTEAFVQSELTNYLEANKSPLILLITTVLISLFWFKHFPNSCPAAPVKAAELEIALNPYTVCWYKYADKIFYTLVVTALILGLEQTCVFFTTLRFHERTFKSRIIDCRFKLYVVQQLMLKALDVARERIRDGNMRPGSASLSSIGGMDSSASQPGLGDEEEASYLSELARYLTSFFSRSRILNKGQMAIDTAATFVQVQAEDPDASAPMPQTASQNYGRFSRTLKRHMQLYGYTQFAKNRSCLKAGEAKLLARDLFAFLSAPGREHLLIEDFAPCFATTRATSDAFAVFDEERDGKVTKREFRNAIVGIYKEMRDLTKSIRTASSALEKLDMILKGGVGGLVFLMALALFSVNVTNLLTLSLSVIIGLNFIFGDMAKHFFTAMVMLFVNHPYDIGDTIVVGLFEEGVYLKDILTVRKINLMNTVFVRWNGQETYVPNHMLAAAPFLTNLSRTIEQWEKLDFSVPSTTSSSQLAKLRHVIGDFLRKSNRDYFTVFDMHAVVAADIGNAEKSLDALEFTLRVKCRPTTDPQKRWERHAKLIKFIKVTLEREIGHKSD